MAANYYMVTTDPTLHLPTRGGVVSASCGRGNLLRTRLRSCNLHTVKSARWANATSDCAAAAAADLTGWSSARNRFGRCRRRSRGRRHHCHRRVCRDCGHDCHLGCHGAERGAGDCQRCPT